MDMSVCIMFYKSPLLTFPAPSSINIDNVVINRNHMEKDCSQRHHLTATNSYGKEELLKFINIMLSIGSNVRHTLKKIIIIQC